MEKAYNLSVLFQENEFDVQKGCNRYGTKEAYFSVLHRFTLDSEVILGKYRPEQYDCGDINIETLVRGAERLQGLLANIGAVNLAWGIQSLSHLLDKKHYVEYSKKLAEIMPGVRMLRERIISAEKKDGDLTSAAEYPQGENTDEVLNGVKRKAKLRSGDFERLLMLIDNFEFESAEKAASSIMLNSYTPDIDQGLEDVYNALHEFNYTKSLKKAQGLLELVTNTQNSGQPAKKKILAIDDMPDVLRTVEAMLKDRYIVYGMTDYDSAVKFMRSNTADLIMLDIEMPGLDGFAMMQLFRCLPDYAETPVIFLTGNVSDNHIKMAVNLGASDFIKKPVDLAVLVNKIENAIHRK